MVEAIMESIIASTQHGVILCGSVTKTGVIEEGKYSDLLIVNENPLDNIASLQNKENIFMLFKEGELIISN